MPALQAAVRAELRGVRWQHTARPSTQSQPILFVAVCDALVEAALRKDTRRQETKTECH